jgi:hypothetical protein
MKIYTREQKEEAKKKLPKPILDFLKAPELVTLYVGIKDKLKLNLRQMMAFAEIVNVTLMGLEEEHAFETNLHQWLPELSNTDTRELAADINDRIFKEAARRLEQHIVASDPAWDEEDLGPKELYEGKEVSDAELDQLVKKEEKEGWTPPPDPNAGPEGDIPEDTSPDEDDAATRVPGAEAAPAVAHTQGLSVAAERLAAPTTTKPTAAGAPAPSTDTPQQQTSQQAPQAPRAYKGTDPYREPVE